MQLKLVMFACYDFAAEPLHYFDEIWYEDTSILIVGHKLTSLL